MVWLDRISWYYPHELRNGIYEYGGEFARSFGLRHQAPWTLPFAVTKSSRAQFSFISIKRIGRSGPKTWVSIYGARLLRLRNIDVSGEPVEYQLRVPPEVVISLEALIRAFDPEELLVL